ncbi:MAG: hypothetical protein H6584_00330 [Flavobacteriales bacterium]|nr:hypothetical protein [Flavobacteriales bacterium]
MKKIRLGILLLLVVVFGVYQYTYQDHRDIATEKAAYVLSVKDLHDKFLKDAAQANIEYGDKTIELSGIITAVDTSSNSIVLDQKLFGILLDQTIKVQEGAEVTIKGRFLGYDDLLEELKFDQVTIIK